MSGRNLGRGGFGGRVGWGRRRRVGVVDGGVRGSVRGRYEGRIEGREGEGEGG